MISRRNIIFITLLVLSGFSYAGSNPYYGETENLGVLIYPIKDKNSFQNEWNKPTTPNIKIASIVNAGEPFSFVILFWGGTTEEDGNCNISMDFNITDQNGLVIKRDVGIPVCKDNVPPQKGLFTVGNVFIDIVIDGKTNGITFNCVVKDLVSEDEIKIKIPIKIEQ